MLYLAYFQVISVFLLLLLTSQVVGFFSLFDLIFDIFYIFGHQFQNELSIYIYCVYRIVLRPAAEYFYKDKACFKKTRSKTPEICCPHYLEL